MAGVSLPFQPASAARRIEWFEKSVLPVAGSVFFLFVAYGGITTFVPLFAKSLHVNSGTFFLVFAAALALSRPLSGKLSDRFGEMVVILPALVVTVGALTVLSLSTGLSASSFRRFYTASASDPRSPLFRRRRSVWPVRTVWGAPMPP